LLRHTDRNIILAGVDLAAAKGFTHARPHASIVRLFAAANRLHPLADVLAAQNFAAQSLETYRQWFLQLPPESARRLARAGTGGAPLPNIKTIDLTAGIAESAQRDNRSADLAARTHNAQSSSDNPLAEHQNGTRNEERLSVISCSAPSHTEHLRIVHTLLNTLYTEIPALIAAEPERLAENAPTIEKQVCALCSYTAYCNAIKNPADKKAQTHLTEQVSHILGVLIKRVEA